MTSVEAINTAIEGLKAHPEAEVDEKGIVSVSSSRTVVPGPGAPFLHTNTSEVPKAVRMLHQFYEEYSVDGHPQKKVDTSMYLRLHKDPPVLDTYVTLESSSQRVRLDLDEAGKITRLEISRGETVEFDDDVISLWNLRVRLSKPEEMASRMAQGNLALEIVP